VRYRVVPFWPRAPPARSGQEYIFAIQFVGLRLLDLRNQVRPQPGCPARREHDMQTVASAWKISRKPEIAN
jgi:hypothetical protein